MANYKLYDIGTVSDNTYMYKGVYRVSTQLSTIDRYELMIWRFKLSDGSLDSNYGQNQQGAFRIQLQIKPNNFPLDLSRICPGMMFDTDNKLTLAGIAWMSGLARHGFFIAKLDNTGNLTTYGSGNYGISVGGFDTNIYSCTKELLVDKSNNTIFGVSTREYPSDNNSPSYISRRDLNGDLDSGFGSNGKIEISHAGFTPQITSLTFDNYGNYYVGYNNLKNDGAVFGNSHIKSYSYNGSENTFFSKNGSIIVDAGVTFASEAPQDLYSLVRDQYLDDVKVYLTMNNEDNSSSLTDPVGGETIRFVGDAVISTSNKKFGVSSLRLSGTNNSYLEIGDNQNPSDFPFANSDFCIEAMIYLDAVDDERRIVSLGGNTSTTGLIIESVNTVNDPNSLRVMMGTHTGGNSNIVSLIANNSLVEKQWHHIAFNRRDNNFTLYVDGELKASSHYEGAINLGTSGSLKIGSDQNGENGVIGNIDDLRITIGNARYFNTFELPKYQISNVGRSTDVKLLLHFEGDNNSKTIVDRGVSKISTCNCLGNAEISSDKHRFGGSSLKLDGTNSVVEIPDSKINWPSSFYTSPFTIEGNFNFSDVSKSQVLINKNNSFNIKYTVLGTLKFLEVNLTDNNNSPTRFKILPWEPIVDKWYHIAFVKNGINVGLYVDGQRVINASYLNTMQDGGTSSPWDIGADRAGGTGYFNGHVDEVRIVASAVYTDVFTPSNHEFYPTQEQAITNNDSYQNQDKLLLHFEENDGQSLIDSSNNDSVATLLDGSLNSSSSRYGSKSLSVPSSGTGAQVSKLSSNGNDIEGTSDYTIEMYFKLNQAVNNSVLFRSNSDGLILKISNGGNDQISLGTSESSTGNNYSSSANSQPYLVTNKWYHVAVVRENKVIKTYIDGELRSTNNEKNDQSINGTYVIGEDLDGFIDEVRITNQVARYTSSFTPQNSAFGSEPVPIPEPRYLTANYNNSKLLLHLDSVSSNAQAAPIDSSGNNKVLTVVNVNNSGNGGYNTSGRATNISKFGEQSWKFNLSGASASYAYLKSTDNDNILGTGDFTIETWFYTSGSEQRDQRLIQIGETMPVYISISSDRKIVANIPNASVGNDSFTGASVDSYTGQWVHVALVRSSGVASLYVNGDSVASKNNTYDIKSNIIMIGGNTQISQYYTGYMDEIHIRNSAAYSSNFNPSKYAYGYTPDNYVEPTVYYSAKSELRYMLPITQTSSFISVAKKTNSDSTTYAEVLNIKHNGDYVDTWGNNGKVALSVPGYGYVDPETMWMDRELNVYIGGSAKKISDGLSDGIVWKIDDSGSLDSTFGTNGVDIKNNTTLDETITSIYNDYDDNKMIYTTLFTGDSGSFVNAPMMRFDSYNFGGNLTFLSSYEYISKENTPNEGLNRVLQDMGLTNAAHIKMPASMFNNLFTNTFDENTQRFTTDSISLTVDQSANDNITVVSGGLIKDFWNYFVAKIEALLPSSKRGLWDDAADGANGYTNAKLQTFFRDVGLGSLTVPKINDVIREYETNTTSLFSHRIKSDSSIHHRRDGFIAGDKAGINAGVEITFQATISAATGGTVADTLISETRVFNVLLELE